MRRGVKQWMRKDHKSAAILIFTGFLLIIVFAVGLTAVRNPGRLHSRYMVDSTWEAFTAFCKAWWLPAGIVGFPMFLISLIISLLREAKENRRR